MAIFKDGTRERIEGIGELGDGRTVDGVDISGIKLNSMPTAADGPIDLNDQNITAGGTIKLGEQANAESDTAAYGQLWVKTATPNELYFTNDAGNDIQLTSGTGLASSPASSIAADDITAGDAAVSVSTTSGNVTVDSNAGSVTVDGHTGVTVTSSNSGEVDISSAANVDINATTGITVDATTVSIDGTDNSNLTVTGSGKTLTVSAAGGGAGQEVIISSAGTSENAIQLTASAGGMQVTTAAEIEIGASGTSSFIRHTAGKTGGLAYHIDANAAADSEVQIDAGLLDVDVTAGITIDGTTVSIDGTDDSNLTVTGSAKDLDIAVAGGGTQELRLASAGTGASALHLNASAGSVDIDSADNITVDAADEIVVTTTSADGHIALVSAHTAGVALHIDANADAGSIVDVDAGILDIDVTGASTIDTTSLTVTTDTSIFTSSNTTDPLVTIINTTDDANGARLRFSKDKGSAGAVDDVAGIIEFYADDNAQQQTQFGEIKSQVAVNTNGQEGGKLTLSVASHDGEIQPGLIITDGSAEDEVDVTIGNGDYSVTTIKGDLNLARDNAIIRFGADQDVLLTHTHNTGATLSLTSSATAKPIFHLKNTGDLASGPGLRFVSDNGAGEADDEVLGYIDFKGDDSTDTETVYAKVEARASDVSDGDEGGQIVMSVMSGGTAGTAALNEALSIGGEDVNGSNPAEVCVNRAGTAFIDFRALTDNNSHALFVDASADAVGINNSTPSKELDVAGDALVTSSATTADSVGVVANSLTTGSALSVSSSSSNTSARNLVEVTNSNGSAVATVGMHVNVTGQFGVTSTKQIASTQSLTNKSDGSGQTLSTTEVLNGSVIRTGPSGNYQDTTPTAAQLVAAVPNATVGMFFDFNFYNGTGHTATVAGGSGIVMLNNNAATFDLTGGQFRAFRLFFTNVSSSSESAYMVPMSAAMNPLA